MAHLIPSVSERRLITGFLFGCTGCLITLSPVGKVSGAHINPAVSFAFWLSGHMKTKAFAGYIVSQMLGAIVGSLPLLLWDDQGSSINYANTVPGTMGIWPAFLGEIITTACLITVIFVFVNNKRLHEYTAYTMPFLYCFMVYAETVYSGCSTNPARSFGPAIISNVFTSYWVYISAPVFGAAMVSSIFRWFGTHRNSLIRTARVSHHDQPSPQSNEYVLNN